MSALPDNLLANLTNATPDQLQQLADALSDADIKELQRVDKIAASKEVFLKARNDLLTFAQLMMPDPDHPSDVTFSRYEAAKHHELIAEALTRVERGDCPRLIITMPPRHGKSELATRIFPLYFMGRNPTKEIILAGYSQQFAQRNFGKRIQAMMQTPRFREVFPDVSLDGGSKAVDILLNSEGGQIISVGRGGAITGMGAHLAVIDDPIKNEKEAESEVILDDIWEWFLTTIDTRLYSDGAVIIVMTRWHEDDLVGRLTDPDNIHYNPKLAKDWEILHLPAIFEDEDRQIAKKLDKKVGDALWPQRTKQGMGGYDLEWLERKRLQSERTFSALYQGRPAPLEGDLIKADWLIDYHDEQLPPLESMNFYGASDHATGMRTRTDPSVIGCAGVDGNGIIWIMPDVRWERIQTDVTVTEICDQIERRNPMTWFLESDTIAKAFGPFLRSELQRRRLYATVIQPMPVSQDKAKRAQSARGLLASGRFRFPKAAPWWPRAKKELLAFPNAANDDFVDFISLLGQGLLHMIPGETVKETKIPPEKIPFTLPWVKDQTRKQEILAARARQRTRRY